MNNLEKSYTKIKKLMCLLPRVNKKLTTYFAGPRKEVGMAASTKITQKMDNEYKDVLKELDTSKVHFHCRLRRVWKHTRPHHSMWQLHSKSQER